MFAMKTGRIARLDISIDGYCLTFPVWLFQITIG